MKITCGMDHLYKYSTKLIHPSKIDLFVTIDAISTNKFIGDQYCIESVQVNQVDTPGDF